VYIENLAVMLTPTLKAKLLLYIASSGAAVSATLIEEKKVEGELTQVHIYFVSEAPSRSKLLYSEIEKMAYTVVMAARKLRYYFKRYKIIVPKSYPIRDMFENREAFERIGKWAAIGSRTPARGGE
jgi:hypothetical protein